MILYFSGTGNSKTIANELSALTSEPVGRLVDYSPQSLEVAGDSMGFVFPVYSWGVPPIVLDFIGNLSHKSAEALRQSAVWAVLVCGDETGLAPDMLRDALQRHNIGLKGVWSVIMPNNYVLLPGFDTDPEELEQLKVDASHHRISDIASRILAENWEEDCHRGRHALLKSKLVYPLFKRWGVFPSKWRATDACVGCGLCEDNCPVGNISLSTGGPVWGKECVSCMACFHVCPKKAVEYGRSTAGKHRYFRYLRPKKK